MRDTILTESVYIQKENVAVSKAVLQVYSYIGRHPLTLNDAILRNADVLDRHFNRVVFFNGLPITPKSYVQH